MNLGKTVVTIVSIGIALLILLACVRIGWNFLWTGSASGKNQKLEQPNVRDLIEEKEEKGEKLTHAMKEQSLENKLRKKQDALRAIKEERRAMNNEGRAFFSSLATNICPDANASLIDYTIFFNHCIGNSNDDNYETNISAKTTVIEYKNKQICFVCENGSDCITTAFQFGGKKTVRKKEFCLNGGSDEVAKEAQGMFDDLDRIGKSIVKINREITELKMQIAEEG